MQIRLGVDSWRKTIEDQSVERVGNTDVAEENEEQTTNLQMARYQIRSASRTTMTRHSHLTVEQMGVATTRKRLAS